MPGKRKRDAEVVAREAAQIVESAQPEFENQRLDHDVFRKYFEARFEPLPEESLPMSSLPVAYVDEQSEEFSDKSDWDGISGDDMNATAVQIIDHQSVSDANGEEIDRALSRRFMSSKPPRPEDESKRQPKEQDLSEDQSAESLNLKHDLDLQRLLKESHLLEMSKASTSLGSYRHQALDMRLQSLGSKSSLFVQENMPLAHRKGIAAKATSRESRRRKDAQENGVILERASKTRKSNDFKRKDLGIGAPVVGKFRGGTLKLSRKDLYEIQGPAQRGRGGKARK